jgi:hypothetical protein
MNWNWIPFIKITSAWECVSTKTTNSGRSHVLFSTSDLTFPFRSVPWTCSSQPPTVFDQLAQPNGHTFFWENAPEDFRCLPHETVLQENRREKRIGSRLGAYTVLIGSGQQKGTKIPPSLQRTYRTPILLQLLRSQPLWLRSKSSNPEVGGTDPLCL